MKAILVFLLALVAISSATPQRVMVAEPKDSTTCEVCQYVIGIVENWVLSNYTEAEIQQYLDSLCSIIPGYSQICDAIVQEGLPEVIQYIKNNESPQSVCTQLKLCSSGAKCGAVVQKVANTNCDICTYVVGIVESWLESNSTVQEATQYLTSLCYYVQGFEAICDQIVQYGVQEFVEYIEANEQPETVCTQIGLCSGKTAPVQIEPVKVVKVEGGAQCDLCVYVVNIVEEWVTSNTSEAQIAQYLQALCANVPGFEQLCDQVAQYGLQEFIQYIVSNEQPQTVCTQIGLCTSALKSAPKKVEDTDCQLCQYVIGVLESYVLNNYTIQEIEQRLQTVCSLVPGLSQICDQLTQEVLVVVVQWIQQNETPTQICTQLGFTCNKVQVKQQAIKPAVVRYSDLDCSLCTTVIEAVESWLENNATETEIESDLEDYICALIPGFSATCDAIIQTGVSDVVQWIQQNYTPQDVCNNLGLCQAEKVSRRGRFQIIQN